MSYQEISDIFQVIFPKRIRKYDCLEGLIIQLGSRNSVCVFITGSLGLTTLCAVGELGFAISSWGNFSEKRKVLAGEQSQENTTQCSSSINSGSTDEEDGILVGGCQLRWPCQCFSVPLLCPTSPRSTAVALPTHLTLNLLL